jgi:hypothetical protein
MTYNVDTLKRGPAMTHVAIAIGRAHLEEPDKSLVEPP